MAEAIDIRELNERIERQSAFALPYIPVYSDLSSGKDEP